MIFLPIAARSSLTCRGCPFSASRSGRFLIRKRSRRPTNAGIGRSEEHTSELQSLMRISYAVFCLKKKKKIRINPNNTQLQIYKTSEHHITEQHNSKHESQIQQ